LTQEGLRPGYATSTVKGWSKMFDALAQALGSARVSALDPPDILTQERSMTSSFVDENTASRRRLESLVRRLSDADLARSTSDGWTVAALLAHLAFWDQRVIALLRRWEAKGVDESPVDPDAINDALKPLCLALTPRTAAELCLSSAEAVDAKLEAITADLVKRIQTSPTHFRFNRALHRDDHLNEIESHVFPSSG